MGEVAEMMLDGTLCEGCGVYLGDPIGYPRRCSWCRKGQSTQPKATCPHCKKRVKAAGLSDHIRDAHQVAAKCDGNHGGPRCADLECWNDDAPIENGDDIMGGAA